MFLSCLTFEVAFSQHASHVTMSVIKLLSRIKAPTDLDMMEGHESSDEMSQDLHAHLHDHTYGITSDPLTQFACAFAALVHDVDHQGKMIVSMCCCDGRWNGL